jgi:hypothetical protein
MKVNARPERLLIMPISGDVRWYFNEDAGTYAVQLLPEVVPVLGERRWNTDFGIAEKKNGDPNTCTRI